MRTAVVVALVVGGCAQDDGGDPCGDDGIGIDMYECHSPVTGCGVPCPTVERQAHWLFESEDTGTRSPCLPGSPKVTVSIGSVIGGHIPGFFDCASGTGTLETRAFDQGIHLSSGGYDVSAPSDSNDVDLPTVVVSYSGGYIRSHWRVDDYLGTPNACDYVTSSAVSLRVDDNRPTWQSTNWCRDGVALVGPLPAGVHTLRAQVSRYDATAMSESIDVTVVNADVVDSPTLVVLSP